MNELDEIKDSSLLIRSNRKSMLEFKEQCLKKHSGGERLTLDETAFALWDPEKEAKPMTPMGILKIEKRALLKLKTKLKDYGINSIDDLFDPKFRENGRQDSTKEH